MKKRLYFLTFLLITISLFATSQLVAQGRGNGNSNSSNGNSNGNNNSGTSTNSGNPNTDELQLMLLPNCYFMEKGERMYEWRVENKGGKDVDFVLEDEDGKKLAEGTAKKNETTLVKAKQGKTKGDCNETILKAKSLTDSKKWIEQKNGRKCGSNNKCKDSGESEGDDEDDEDEDEEDDEDNGNDDEDSLACGGFRIQGQGSWGAKPSGNNSGAYLHTQFAKVFPKGIVIGCDKTIKLTTAQAVTDFLPQGGTPAVLTKNYTDTQEKITVLAGQILTLTISVKLDSAIENFSSAKTKIAELIITSGDFKGKTVVEVLEEANKVLGGCQSKYTPTQINDVISKINENFEGGTNKGFLECPPPTDIAIKKLCPDSVIYLGSKFTYKLIIRNLTKVKAAMVVVRDTLPKGVSFVSATKEGKPDSSIVTWNLQSLLAEASDTLQVTVKADSVGKWVNTATISSKTQDKDTTNNLSRCEVEIKEICPLPEKVDCSASFASKTVKLEQGKQKDGNQIDAERSDANNALGIPQENDEFNFISLGFGGMLELELANAVYDHNKGVKVASNVAETEGETSAADFIIVESTFGKSGISCGKNKDENYPEKIAVWGRECEKQTWVKLGEYCRTAFVDVAPLVKAGQKYVKFLKLIDVSDKSLFENKADGYDVDGIIACPETVISAITGEGRKPIVHGKTESNFAFNHHFVNRAPNATTKNTLVVHAYPNPTNQQVNLEITELVGNIEVHLFNAIGILVGKQSFTVDAANRKLAVDVAHYPSGIYILKIVTPHSSVEKSLKIVKQ